MSEDFVDVHWRGLEVARKARLKPDGRGVGQLEHGTPMPIGTALTVRTADGLELAAVVAGVREQIGGRSEPPGMDLALTASGDAAAWWQGRVEAAARAAAEAPVAPARTRTGTAPPAPVVAATPAAVAASAPAIPSTRATATTLEMPILATTGEAPALPADADAGRTVVMAAVAPPEGGRTVEMTAVAAPDDAAEATDGAGAAVVDLGPPAAEAVPQELVDDGRRTTVMAAVDIDAIVAASADAAPAEGGDDEPAPTAGGDKKKPARGKRKRGR